MREVVRVVRSPSHPALSHPPLAGDQGLGGGRVGFSPGRGQGGGVIARWGVNTGGWSQGVREQRGQVTLATIVVSLTQGVVIGALAVGLGGGHLVLPGVDWLSLVLQSDAPTAGVVRPPHSSHH